MTSTGQAGQHPIRRRRRGLALGVACLVVAGACSSGGGGNDADEAATVPTTESRPPPRPTTSASDADEPRALDVDVADITGFEALVLAADGTTMWMTDMDNDVIRSVDLDTGAVGEDIEVGDAPVGIAVDGDEIWVANSGAGDHTVMRVDGASGEVVATIEIEAGKTPTGVALTDDSVWVGISGTGALAQIDRATNTLVKVVAQDENRNAGGIVDVVEAEGSIWAVDRSCGRVLRIDPVAGEITTVFDDLGFDATEPETCTGGIEAEGPVRLAVFDGEVYVLADVVTDRGPNGGRISRIDPVTDEIETVVDLGFSPSLARPFGLPGFVVEDDAVWMSAGDRSVRVDRKTGRADGVFTGTSFSVVSLVEVDGTMWHAVGDSFQEEMSGLYGVEMGEAREAAS